VDQKDGGLGLRYEVRTVESGDLPQGIDHVIVQRPDGPPLLILSGRVAHVWEWVRHWEDSEEPSVFPTVLMPAPRALRAVRPTAASA
jgi:hypothetical protein